MGKSSNPTLLQGTLDLLILHALQRGAMHGYAIAQTIHLLSDEVLKVEEGSLYPALYRELDGAIKASWGNQEQPKGSSTKSPLGQKPSEQQNHRTGSPPPSTGTRPLGHHATIFLKLLRRRLGRPRTNSHSTATWPGQNDPISLGNPASIKEIHQP
jgi:hypothetical protein